MSTLYDAVVIGAGQAGLATGYYLLNANLKFLILESNHSATGSWSNYYDSLKLFSPAKYSSLPGLSFPGNLNRYPLRDEVIQYLLNYAEHFQLPIQTNTLVIDVRKKGELFTLTTNEGKEYISKSVIVATGSFHSPYIPDIPDMNLFNGSVLHSNKYKNPEPFKNQRLVVVGAGNSAVQIAVELSQSANVTIASRSPIKFVPQMILGKDVHFWIRTIGLDQFPIGKSLLQSASSGVLDTGKYRKDVNENKPEHRPMFTKMTSDSVIWEDGIHEKIDSIIFATGYQFNVPFLNSLNVLDPTGGLLHNNGVSTNNTGLYFMGLSFQRSHASATIRGVGNDAKYIVKRLKQYVTFI